MHVYVNMYSCANMSRGDIRRDMIGICTWIRSHVRVHTIHVRVDNEYVVMHMHAMGWLWLVGSIKS